MNEIVDPTPESASEDTGAPGAGAPVPPVPSVTPPVVPSRRDRLKPLELLGFSGVIALFAGLVILGVTRGPVLALVFAVIVFIACVLMVALVGLGGKPSDEDLEARKDLKPRGEDFH